MAETLEEIAAGGADALYKGRIGKDLIQDIHEEGRTGPGFLVEGWVQSSHPLPDRFVSLSGCVLPPGGTITLEDLHSYHVEVTDPWTFSLGDYQMHVPPPPAGGVLLGLVLNILKGR